MAAYHVFVDGAADASPAGKDRLATAIASHYGMPLDAVRARVDSGRFRVKGNCDRTTADTYKRDLEQLGAVCSIEEASSANVAKTPLPFPAVTPQRNAGTALPPRQTTPPAIARTTSGNKGYQSGLSAAFSGEQNVGSLGALENATEFKLSSVDGNESSNDNSNENVGGSFGPPPEAAAPAPAKKAAASAEPIDMFAPPDASDASMAVELASDEVERSAKKRASIPPENIPPPEEPRARGASLQPPTRSSRPSLQAPTVPVAAPQGIREPRARFAVGVALAIVVGFVPAHVVASSREKSAAAEVDVKVIELQKQVATPEDYAALDGMRANQLARKHDDRRNIAMLALLIWAVVGAGVAFAWFKKIVPDEAG